LHGDEFNKRVREVATDLLNHLHSSESETWRGKMTTAGGAGHQQGFGGGEEHSGAGGSYGPPGASGGFGSQGFGGSSGGGPSHGGAGGFSSGAGGSERWGNSSGENFHVPSGCHGGSANDGSRMKGFGSHPPPEDVVNQKSTAAAVMGKATDAAKSLTKFFRKGGDQESSLSGNDHGDWTSQYADRGSYNPGGPAGPAGAYNPNQYHAESTSYNQTSSYAAPEAKSSSLDSYAAEEKPKKKTTKKKSKKKAVEEDADEDEGRGRAASIGGSEIKAVDDFCMPAGTRPAPTREQIAEFVKRCKTTLDPKAVAEHLDTKMKDAATEWKVKLRALFATEALVKDSQDEVSAYFKKKSKSILALTSMAQASVSDKAKKVAALLDIKEEAEEEAEEEVEEAEEEMPSGPLFGNPSAKPKKTPKEAKKTKKKAPKKPVAAVEEEEEEEEEAAAPTSMFSGMDLSAAEPVEEEVADDVGMEDLLSVGGPVVKEAPKSEFDDLDDLFSIPSAKEVNAGTRARTLSGGTLGAQTGMAAQMGSSKMGMPMGGMMPQAGMNPQMQQQMMMQQMMMQQQMQQQMMMQQAMMQRGNMQQPGMGGLNAGGTLGGNTGFHFVATGEDAENQVNKPKTTAFNFIADTVHRESGLQ